MVIEINFLNTSNEAPKVPRSYEDTLRQLFKQYKFLCKSILECYKGDLDEIDRIAQALRILFHNTKNSISLLSQLNYKIQIIDTSPSITNQTINQDSKKFVGGLVSINLCDKNFWKLNPVDAPPWSEITDWWNKVLFIENNIQFTRKMLILDIADADGGAHIDPVLKKDYFYLTRKGSIAMMFFREGENFCPPGPEKLLVPHIGLEVATSLKHAYPEICIDMGLPYLQTA